MLNKHIHKCIKFTSLLLLLLLVRRLFHLLNFPCYISRQFIACQIHKRRWYADFYIFLGAISKKAHRHIWGYVFFSLSLLCFLLFHTKIFLHSLLNMEHIKILKLIIYFFFSLPRIFIIPFSFVEGNKFEFEFRKFYFSRFLSLSHVVVVYLMGSYQFISRNLLVFIFCCYCCWCTKSRK